MNNNKRASLIQEYFCTFIVSIILIFSLCMCFELQLYFNTEEIINKRELKMKNLFNFYNISQLEAMHKKDPNNHMISINLAKAYETIQNYSLANDLYKKAIISSGNSEYSLYVYAVFCAKRKWYGLATDLAEELYSNNKKKTYKYKAEIYYELAKSMDENKEYDASVKAYQIAYKYAKNIKDKKIYEAICEGYSKEFIKLADYHINNNQPDKAILDLNNSLGIKEQDIAKYKLGLIYQNTDKVLAEKYFNEVFKHNPYIINPYIYNKLLQDLILDSKQGNNMHGADFYNTRLNNLKSKMKESYLFKGDLYIDNSKIVRYKKMLSKDARYELHFDIKNNTKLNINKLYILPEIYMGEKKYTAEKKISNSNNAGYFDIMEDVIVGLPEDFQFDDLIKKKKQKDVIIKYYAKKQSRAPWTLIKIEFLKF